MTGSSNLSLELQPFELHAGALRLALRPDLGGCIAGFWHRDLAVLRSTEPALLSASRPSASFPLLPYSNRLGYRKFRWKGRDYTTQPNFADNPHSVHGVGWLRPWEIVSSSALEVVLSYHRGGCDRTYRAAARCAGRPARDRLGDAGCLRISGARGARGAGAH